MPNARRILLAALLVLLALPAAADREAIRDVEATRYRAMVRNDFETLQVVLSDDLVYTHSNGRVDDKEALLGALQDGTLRYRKMELGKVDIRAWGDTGLVTGRVTMHVTVKAGEESRDLTLPARFTAVYRFGEEGWKLVNWQSTGIAE